MHRPEVEIAFWRDVGNVDGDVARVAEGVDFGACGGVVDGREDEGGFNGVEEGGGEEGGVVGEGVGAGVDAVEDFGGEAGGGGDEVDVRVGGEEGENAAGGDLRVC